MGGTPRAEGPEAADKGELICLVRGTLFMGELGTLSGRGLLGATALLTMTLIFGADEDLLPCFFLFPRLLWEVFSSLFSSGGSSELIFLKALGT